MASFRAGAAKKLPSFSHFEYISCLHQAGVDGTGGEAVLCSRRGASVSQLSGQTRSPPHTVAVDEPSAPRFGRVGDIHRIAVIGETLGGFK